MGGCSGSTLYDICPASNKYVQIRAHYSAPRVWHFLTAKKIRLLYCALGDYFRRYNMVLLSQGTVPFGPDVHGSGNFWSKKIKGVAGLS